MGNHMGGELSIFDSVEEDAFKEINWVFCSIEFPQ
jgi:hypothetical protein